MHARARMHMRAYIGTSGVCCADRQPARQVRRRIAYDERLAEYRRNSVLFDISSSMEPYFSVFRAYIDQLRLAIVFVESKHLDEVSNRSRWYDCVVVCVCYM